MQPISRNAAFHMHTSSQNVLRWNAEAANTLAHHPDIGGRDGPRSEEHTSELQSRSDHVCRLLLEKKKNGVATMSTRDRPRLFAIKHSNGNARSTLNLQAERQTAGQRFFFF